MFGSVYEPVKADVIFIPDYSTVELRLSKLL